LAWRHKRLEKTVFVSGRLDCRWKQRDAHTWPIPSRCSVCVKSLYLYQNKRTQVNFPDTFSEVSCLYQRRDGEAKDVMSDTRVFSRDNAVLQLKNHSSGLSARTIDSEPTSRFSRRRHRQSPAEAVFPRREAGEASRVACACA